jgi:hypothetical protein
MRQILVPLQEVSYGNSAQEIFLQTHVGLLCKTILGVMTILFMQHILKEVTLGFYLHKMHKVEFCRRSFLCHNILCAVASSYII